jgi:hypothetical protein
MYAVVDSYICSFKYPLPVLNRRHFAVISHQSRFCSSDWGAVQQYAPCIIIETVRHFAPCLIIGRVSGALLQAACDVNVGCSVLTTVSVRIVFWCVGPCSSADGCQWFGVTCCLHLDVESVLKIETAQRRYACPAPHLHILEDIQTWRNVSNDFVELCGAEWSSDVCVRSERDFVKCGNREERWVRADNQLAWWR